MSAFRAKLSQFEQRYLATTDPREKAQLEDAINRTCKILSAIEKRQVTSAVLRPVSVAVREAPAPVEKQRPRAVAMDSVAVAQSQQINQLPDLTRIHRVTAKSAKAYLSGDEQIPHNTAIASAVDRGYKMLANEGVSPDVIMNIVEMAKPSARFPGVHEISFAGRGFNLLPPELKQAFMDTVPVGFVIAQESVTEEELLDEAEELVQELKDDSGDEEAPEEEGGGFSAPAPKPTKEKEEEPEEEEESSDNGDIKEIKKLLEDVAESIHDIEESMEEAIDDRADPYVQDREQWETDELTNEEFGLGFDDESYSNIYGRPASAASEKERTMQRQPRNLRSQRRARIASRRRPARRLPRIAADNPDTELLSQWSPKEKSYKTHHIVHKTVNDGAMKGQSKKDIEMLPGIYRAAVRELNVELNTQKNAWLIQKGTTPVFRISKANVKARDFGTRKFGERIIATILSRGLRHAVRVYRAVEIRENRSARRARKRRPVASQRPIRRRALAPGKGDDKNKKKILPKPEEKEARRPSRRPHASRRRSVARSSSIAPRRLRATAERAATKARRTLPERAALCEPIARRKATAERPVIRPRKAAKGRASRASRKPVLRKAARHPKRDERVFMAATEMYNDASLRWRRALALAAKISERNLGKGRNPLKCALFEGFQNAGIDEPHPIIEAAFQQSYEEHLTNVLRHADELVNMSDEALADLEYQVENLQAHIPQEAPQRTASRVEAEEMRRQASYGSIPVQSGSPMNPHVMDQRREAIRQAIPIPQISLAATRYHAATRNRG